MLSITRDTLAEDSLLKTHRGAVHPERWGNYGDCFSVAVERVVPLADFVFAFYTSRLFRIERSILRVLAGARADNADARALAQGSATTYSVWYAGERTATQLLMCDRYERTRSWFRVVPLDGDRTLLQFGSAVAAAPENAAPGKAAHGKAAKVSPPSAGFRVLLRFHILYSQLLLSAARAGLMSR